MLLVTEITSGVLQEKAHYQIGADKEFNVGRSNFVILLLDTVDARTFSKLLEDHHNKDFQDFTYFENTVGAYSCTKRSIPLFPETGSDEPMITCTIYHRFNAFGY